MKKILLIGLTAVVAVGIAVPMALGVSAPKATGSVDWVYGNRTGNTTFNAQGTPTDAKGQLATTDGIPGGFLNGVVTCFNRIDDKTAIFSGTITDGSSYYMVGANPYFKAKVVDNGESGAAGPDTIAIHANYDGGTDCSVDTIADAAIVTGGNLTVH